VVREGRKDSSFSEEKEEKRLSITAPRIVVEASAQVGKVFWFFFSKKNVLPCLLLRCLP
jgi:hypothetical protein